MPDLNDLNVNFLQQLGNKKLIIIIVLLIIGFLFYYNFQNNLEKQKEELQQKQKKETPSQQTPTITIPKILYNLYGNVQKIEENDIIFEAQIPQIDQNNQGSFGKEIRKIIITPSTEFTKLIFVTDKTTGIQMPTEIKITLKDIKIGNYIEVLSNQNISQAEEFEATKIRIKNP
jgi:hypothetical protein